MTRVSSNTSMGIHLSAFEGVYKKPGPVTYGDLIDNFPHIRSYGDEGWEISKITVKGSIFKTLVRAIANLKDIAGVNMYGVTYNAITLPNFLPLIGGKVWAFNFRIDGKAVNNKEHYTMSFPTEVGHALRTTLPKLTQVLFPSMEDTGVFYWNIMEDYVKKNSPIKCLK